MHTVVEIADAIRNLSVEDLAAFRNWFAEFDAEKWDDQIEADAKAGRLVWLRDEAIRQIRRVPSTNN